MANIAAKNSDDAKIVLHATAVNGSEETQRGEKARMELGHSSPQHNCGRLTAVQPLLKTWVVMGPGTRYSAVRSARLGHAPWCSIRPDFDYVSFGRTPVGDAAVK